MDKEVTMFNSRRKAPCRQILIQSCKKKKGSYYRFHIIFQHRSCAVITQKDFAITFLDENLGFFYKKEGKVDLSSVKPESKNERTLYLDPALWCGGGRGRLLARKKRRDEGRNQVTETNLTWSQLLFKSLTVSDSRSTRRKVPQRLHVQIRSLW